MDNNVRRIGVLAPPGNVAMERELPRYVPEGVIVNHNRMSRPGSGITRESLLAMIDSVDRAAHDLAQAYPEVILYGCTSGSFLAGPGREDELGTRITAGTGNMLTMDRIEHLERELGVPVLSSNQCTLWAALKHMKVDASGVGCGALFETTRQPAAAAA
mgnify:CR=1 FL=1